MTITLIKLSDGTEVIGNVVQDDLRSIIVKKPLLIHYRYFIGGVPSVSFSRYMMFAASTHINLYHSHVIAKVEARKAFADYYMDSVEDYYGNLESTVDEELKSALSTTEKEQDLKKLLDMMPIDKATVN
jgi:hypothetical protein